MTKRVKVVGVTGGICSGKSLITKLLSDLCNERNVSCLVIDADKVAHKIYEVGSSCYYKVIRHFGDSIIDYDNSNAINRKVLGSIVFNDKKKLKELESIVWDEMKIVIHSMIEETKQQYQQQTDDSIDRNCIVVLEAAIMIEAGWNKDLIDELIVSSVECSVAIDRLKVRNNLSEEDAVKRINSQLTNEERIAYADKVIVNNTNDLNDLKNRIDSLFSSILI